RPARGAQGKCARRERRSEATAPGHERAPDNLATEVPAPQYLSVARAKWAQASVEPADENSATGDCRSGIAQSTDPRGPDQVPAARGNRIDLSGAGDGEDAPPVGRRARVEALVAKDVAAKVFVPELVPVPDSQAEDRTCVRRDEEAVAGDRRTGVDPAAGVVRPLHPTGAYVHREDSPARRAEIDDAPDRDRRRLAPGIDVHPPGELAVETLVCRHMPVMCA